jgi:hypothetical protein
MYEYLLDEPTLFTAQRLHFICVSKPCYEMLGIFIDWVIEKASYSHICSLTRHTAMFMSDENQNYHMNTTRKAAIYWMTQRQMLVVDFLPRLHHQLLSCVDRYLFRDQLRMTSLVLTKRRWIFILLSTVSCYQCMLLMMLSIAFEKEKIRYITSVRDCFLLTE